MIKLAKWLYELGYKHGWDKAVEEARRGNRIITSAEGEQMRVENEALMELLKEQEGTKQ